MNSAEAETIQPRISEIVIPDEPACGGRDPVSSKWRFSSGFRISAVGGFRNDGIEGLARGVKKQDSNPQQRLSKNDLHLRKVPADLDSG
jgi:hypothetical protein